MSLPKWIELRKEMCIPVEEEDIIEALSIAWKALETIAGGSLGVMDAEKKSRETMRRIEELGK